jgi:hypothetical protein
LINVEAETIADLSDNELIHYNREVKLFYESYRENWKDIVQDVMPYQEPNLVNANLRGMLENTSVPLYVYPCFIKTAKQYYVVK